jgi:hypothetical protein
VIFFTPCVSICDIEHVCTQTMLKTEIRPANVLIGTITDKRLMKMKLTRRGIMQVEGRLMQELDRILGLRI